MTGSGDGGRGTGEPASEGPDADVRRRRAIDLLEANHAFPGDFSLSVIARNDDVVTAAIIAAVTEVGPLGEGRHERRPSGGGKYVSHRVVVFCPTAEAVLDLFARVRQVEGVITVL